MKAPLMSHSEVIAKVEHLESLIASEENRLKAKLQPTKEELRRLRIKAAALAREVERADERYRRKMEARALARRSCDSVQPLSQPSNTRDHEGHQTG